MTPDEIAMTVVMMMLMSSAAGTFRTYRTIVISKPDQGHATSPQSSGRRTSTGTGPSPTGRRDEPAVDEADEQDEQADADADRPLQGQRHGLHDRLAQADQDEHA